MKRRLTTAALVVLPVLITTATAAHAAWTKTAFGSATASSASMPTGPIPTAGISGGTVTLSWSAVQYIGTTTNVAGYTVQRLKGGVAEAVAGTCAGSVTALTCTDSVSATGSYTYKLTPKSGAWVGALGAASNTVNYAPATVAGIAWKSMSTSSPHTTPTCTGTIGATYTCKFTSSSTNQSATGTIAFVDAEGNELAFSDSTQTITITGAASQPNISPTGNSTIPGGQTRSALAKTVTMQGSSARSVTATFNGWTAVLTIGP